MARIRYLWVFAAALYGQTGSVNVLVQDATTDTPLAGVELKLSVRSRPLVNWSARTDLQGKAAFDHLPDGYYYLEANQDGYLDSKVTFAAQYVVIKGGAPAADVKVRLTKATSLEGRVIDEDGRPMKGVTIHAVGKEMVSDAEGRFKIENLRDGKVRLDFRVPMEVRKKTLVRDPESGILIGYPAVEFYPGVADAAEGQMIQIVAGVDLRGYEVRLRRMQLADFTGVTEPGVNVELQTPSSTSPMLDDTIGLREVGKDGRFAFELIPPGQYVLMIYRGDKGTGLPYMVPVEVGKNGVRDKKVAVPPYQTIRGVLRAKDDTPWSGEVTVSVQSNQKGVINRDLRIRSSGEFEIEDVPPGEWQLAIGADSASRASDKRKMIVAGARFGASDAITQPITVVESGNPLLQIEISAETGIIAGRVRSPGQVSVLVERVGTARRYSVFPGGQLKPDGSFVVEGLAPGMYDVHTFTGKAVRVEVKAGETVTVEVE
jgi:hypothetical protein